MLPVGPGAGDSRGNVMDSENDTAIADREFIRRVKRLRRLRDFIVSEGVEVDGDGTKALHLGRLNQLHLSRRGRPPSLEEWQALDSQVCVLFRLLRPDNRKKYLLREFPSWLTVIAALALVLSVVAFFVAIAPIGVASLIAELGRIAFTWLDPMPQTVELGSFVLWVVCLSALGSIAFISVNALSIQNDATFDITNGKFVWLRIVLGILFGVIITLPSAYQMFIRFTQAMQALVWHGIASGAGKASVIDTGELGSVSVTQIAILIFPFLVGFSASLFMAIITRMVAGIQSMFGIDGRQAVGVDATASGGAGMSSPQVALAPAASSILGAHAGGQSIL